MDTGNPKISGCLIDLDGTVYQNGSLIAGADRAIGYLRDTQVPFRFVTNTTRVSRDDLVNRLLGMGMSINAEDILTAPRAASEWLRRQQVSRVSLLLPDAAKIEFDDFDDQSENPQAVVVGDLGAQWDYHILNRAFRHLLEGAELLALHKNRYCREPDGLALDAGPFVAALEYASGKSAVLAGKPSPAFFQVASAQLGVVPAEIAIVGDGLESEVGGAHTCGALGVLVKTGKFRPEDLESQSCVPDHVLDSIADLPRIF